MWDKIKREYETNPFFIPVCVLWITFIIMVMMFLTGCHEPAHQLPNGRKYELKERCVVGYYDNREYSECGRVVKCDSSVIDTF